MIKRRRTIEFNFGDKHKEYIRQTLHSAYNIAEGSIRSGKTTDNIYAFARDIKESSDRIFLVTASTQPTAKLIVGDCDGYGLEHIFRGQCRWGKYKGNDCLIIKGADTACKQKVVLFCGGAKADSYKKFRGMTVGAWLATEIDLHHRNTIDEALKRQIKADRKKLYWDLNPDNPGKFIYTDYIDKWQQLNNEGKLLGGYNYRQFCIFDNPNIPRQNLKEVLSRYIVGSVFYRRDILGMRCAAEGLIYEQFAENAQPFRCSRDSLPQFRHIILGIDWGGNKSKHALQLTGITTDRKLYALRSMTMIATGMTPERLYSKIAEFAQGCTTDFGTIGQVYADCAEQVLINGLRTRLDTHVYDSEKGAIIDRIRAANMMMSQGRFFLLEGENEELEKALASAVWDESSDDDKRLDNGSYCVDILDAWEYSWSHYIQQLTRR